MSTDLPDKKRFNHTIKYQRELLNELPEGARTALDLGCGEGLAARTLAHAGLSVVGVDIDEPSIERARAQWSEGIEYVVADILTADLEPADVVYSGALLHHMDVSEGLERMRTLVKPGGVLLIVGTARNTWRDIPLEIGASVADKAFAIVRGAWKPETPTVWPPPHTYREVESAAYAALPGAEYKQQLLWRYTIRWQAPLA